MAFGAGMAVGAALWAQPHWGSGSITINNANFNNFNGRYNSLANQASNRVGADSTWAHDVAHRDGVPYGSAALNNRYGVANHSDIDRQSIARQQNAANDWKNNASPEDKQRADQARQNANSDFQRNATAQERQQASSLNSQARSDASEDRANPNAAREASQERQLGSQGRSDFNQDRFGGGSRGGSFGGGHMGGFRR